MGLLLIVLSGFGFPVGWRKSFNGRLEYSRLLGSFCP
jgi:hypothetical protein